ncbi:membrane hypothetical protein [Candidatus Accumulibacter aalborgensis]|uniref:EamA domain-containing protein n=1 Tax=Candidatus Accumulibacter aalborgensis TaxID=1860102 RepID=A0A1A8XN76_9PROT|nr:membrane hypothetical protein [Candidatus Accumulibacter aalborgensis]
MPRLSHRPRKAQESGGQQSPSVRQSDHTTTLTKAFMDAASIARLFLLAAIWGASFLFMRVSVPAFGPVAFILFRVAIAAGFLWLASRWLKQKLELGHHWRYFLILGVLNSALPFILFAYAAQSLPASLLSIRTAACGWPAWPFCRCSCSRRSARHRTPATGLPSRCSVSSVPGQRICSTFG